MKTQDVKMYAAQQLHRLQSLPDNQRRAELAGGIVLILIGVRILIEHLTGG